jgi:hypothetical protein
LLGNIDKFHPAPLASWNFSRGYGCCHARAS